VIQQQNQIPSTPAPPVQVQAAYHSETATYVNIVSPSTRQAPPPYSHHTPPAVVRPPMYPGVSGGHTGSGGHPGSGGHVPYSPAFQHHQHVRPVGIANVIPRQGQILDHHANNPYNYQRSQTASVIGKKKICSLIFLNLSS
jgi:hypothetical protein